MEVVNIFKILGIPKTLLWFFMNEENGLRGGTKYEELSWQTMRITYFFRKRFM
jgi:hypothetical protein